MALRRRSGGWSERRRRTCILGIILVALFLWAALLVRMVASSPSAPSPYSKGPPPCESAPRVMWAPRVVLPSGTEPSAIHVAADGKIAKAWPSSRDDAEAYAQTRGVSFEPLGFGDVISPGVVDAAAHLAEWLEPPGRSYEGFSSGTQAAAAGGMSHGFNALLSRRCNQKRVSRTRPAARSFKHLFKQTLYQMPCTLV